MPTDQRFTIRVYEGPSLVAPYAAIVAEFGSALQKPLPSQQVLGLLKELYPFLSQLVLALADDNTDFAGLVVALKCALQERFGLGTESASTEPSGDGQNHRIIVRFNDVEVARNTLLIGMEIADAIFARANGQDVDIQESARKIHLAWSEISGLPHSKITAALLRKASAKEIPVYPISRRTGIYAFGQGANAFLYQEMANSEDSLIGWKLARHKAATRQLLQQLGLPNAKNKLAANVTAARRIAGEFGYPLVVKPTDRTKGIAVSVGITTDDELDAAFARALAASTLKQALIERYVTGDDHRLTVLGGKLMGAHRLIPPQIVGDGTRSVAELIEAENFKRKHDDTAGFYCAQLVIDKDMTTLLRKQGFELEDHPPQDCILKLRQTSNLHTGGTREDATASIHPDNVVMAETIAENFRLDAIGIDFITPDITKAWYEIECAIIEVNSNPGVSNETFMEKMLSKRFPGESDGRIPSFLVVGLSAELVDYIVKYVSAYRKRVGHTSGTRTQLAGQLRFRDSADLPARILSLLLDSTCEALVVACSPDEIAEYGLPHTHYDLALIAKPSLLAEDMRQLIENNSSQTIENVSMERLDEAVQPSIAKILNVP